MMPSRREQSWKASSASLSVHGAVFRPARLVQEGVLRPDARIVETGRDRVGVDDLAVLVLQQVGAVAVQDAGLAAGERGRVHAGLDAMAAGFDADHPDALVFEEGMEQADGVRAAADAGDQRIRQAAFGFQDLLLALRGR